MICQTIMIEKVQNGWIVRPFSGSQHWCQDDKEIMFVYRTIEEVQKDLPLLIANDHKCSTEITDSPKPNPDFTTGT